MKNEFDINNLPGMIKFIRKVEIYEANDIVKLHYRGYQDALYKYSGAIFGLSLDRVLEALNKGDAVPYFK